MILQIKIKMKRNLIKLNFYVWEKIEITEKVLKGISKRVSER